MNKKFLTLLAFAVCFNATAQNKKIMNTSKAADVQPKSIIEEPTVSSQLRSMHKSGLPSTQSSTVLSIGPNAIGMASTARCVIWADPSINAISFIHRNSSAQTGFGISGDLNADFSIDGGINWSINLPLYGGASSAGPLFPARYPSGAIYNPLGNLIAANAYAVGIAPTLDGTNGAWGGFANASNQLNLSSTPVSAQLSSDTAAGFFQEISSGFQIIKNTGDAVAISASLDILSGYTDNFIFYKGTWNAGIYNYTRSLVAVPVSTSSTGNKALAQQVIAFNDAGDIGYIACIGHNDFIAFPDEAYYPIIYKTIDGGTSWTGPINLDISSLETLIPAFNGTTGNLVSTSFELDVAVDAADNLHIVTSACGGAGNFSIVQGMGASVIVDIYTTDGGITWAGQALGVPSTGRGTYGDGSTANTSIQQDNRAQVSRNWDGTKLFFTWFDTDTMSFAGLGNTYPDAYAVAYNVTTGLWTSTDPANSLKTPGISSMMCAQSSYYAFDDAGVQMVPIAYQIITGTTATGEPLNTGSYVDYVYSDDVVFSDADYSGLGAPLGVLRIAATGINDVQTIVASSISLIPNPANGSTKLTYLLNSSSDVTIKVVNLIGATVTSMVQPAQTVGQHEVQLNISDLKAGVYFVNVTANGSVSTSKLIIK